MDGPTSNQGDSLCPITDRTPPAAWVTIALLGLMSILSFVDRYILALLVAPLKAELGLTDIQLGLLFGSTFAAFYGLASLPLARIADLGSRKWLLVAAVAVWSLCTSASALANSFAMLALLRAGLAIGEAALSPTGFSLIVDSFPQRSRVFALTIFSVCGMTGAATAYMIGAGVISVSQSLVASGQFAGMDVWRLCFLLVGLPGIVLAALFALVVREPARHGADVHPPTIRAIFAYIRSKGMLFVGLFAGTGFAQLVANTMAAWSPTYLERTFGLTPEAAGVQFGIAQIFAAVGGTFFLPIFMRRLVARGRVLTASRIPAVFGGLGSAFVIVSVMLATPTGFLGSYAIGGFLLLGTANMSILILQPVLPAQMRATVTALGLICVTAFGLGFGPALAAVFQGFAGEGQNPLGFGIAGIAVAGIIGSAGFYSMAIKRLELELKGL